jgi:hypothetical protein
VLKLREEIVESSTTATATATTRIISWKERGVR